MSLFIIAKRENNTDAQEFLKGSVKMYMQRSKVLIKNKYILQLGTSKTVSQNWP